MIPLSFSIPFTIAGLLCLAYFKVVDWFEQRASDRRMKEIGELKPMTLKRWADLQVKP